MVVVRGERHTWIHSVGSSRILRIALARIGTWIRTVRVAVVCWSSIGVVLLLAMHIAVHLWRHKRLRMAIIVVRLCLRISVWLLWDILM